MYNVCCLTGTNRATLVRNVLNPVGLVVYGSHVYWIDQESRNVMKIKKTGEIHGSTVQGAIDGLSDMVVVDTRKSTGRDMHTSDTLFHSQYKSSLL